MSQHLTELFRTSCGASAPLEINVAGPGRASGERYGFETPFVLVGRHERSCLRLEDGEVSRRHAYLQQLGGRVFCVDLASRTGIRWEGKPRPSGWLRPEQRVQIGPFTLEPVSTAVVGESKGDAGAQDWDPLQDRATDARFLPRITVEVGNEVLSRLCMNRMLVLVGSSPACRLRLRDNRVSRYHCSLVSTPQGVWLIDLLSGSGTCVNGQVLRWALVKEGDRLQVGPYVLRVWYPNVRAETPSPSLVEVPAAAPVQPVDHMQESRLEPYRDQRDVQSAATEVSDRVSALQAELDLARERQREAESLRQQLADSQAECDRLREQVCALEVQVAEAAGLETRLEAAEAGARELEVVRLERERWQTEAQDLQARLEAQAGEQEQLRGLVADLHAAQAEQECLQSEHKAAQQSAEQAWGRVSDLERALAEAATAQASALEEARAGWESERQALEACLEAHGQTHQAAVREVQAQAAAEREEWQQQLEAAQQQLVQERETARAAKARLDHEIAALQQVQADLAARNAEHDATLQRLQQAQKEMALAQDEARSLQTELDQARERQRDAESLRQQLMDVRAEHAQLSARVPELEDRAGAADHLWAQLRAAGAEVEQLRERVNDAESRGTELEAVRAECGRLREQVCALEVQVAEAAGLETRLEAAEAGARELKVVRLERERWQTEAQDLQARLEAQAGEQEQLRGLVADLHAAQAEQERLQSEHKAAQQSAEQAWGRVSDLERALAEAATAQAQAAVEREEWQQQLEQEREGARAVSARLDHEIAALQQVQADLAARNAEHDATLQRLQQAQEKMALAQDEARSFQTELDQAREHQHDVEILRRQLADSQAECDRLREHVSALEIQSEQKASQQAAEQAWGRVSELERALAEASTAQATAFEEARAGWESERQALEARLEAQNQSRHTAVRDVQARASLEREEWRQRLQGAEMQLVWERGMFQEQGEQIRQQAARLQAERDQLAARLSQAELKLQAAEQRPPDEPSPASDLQHLRQLAAREQVFVQLSSVRPGHLLQQTARGLRPNAPTEQARTSATIFREGSLAEEQLRLTAIAQEVQAAWAEAPVGQERLPAISNPTGRIGGQVAEARPDGGGDRPDERRSASAVLLAVPTNEGEPSAPSDAPLGSPVPPGESPPAGETLGCLPEQKDSQPKARSSLWRQIVNRVLGK